LQTCFLGERWQGDFNATPTLLFFSHEYGNVHSMTDVNEWRLAFKEALDKKQIYLSRTKIPELKAKFAEFRTAFATLYAMLRQRNLIVEDPYKEDGREIDLRMPETSPLTEQKKREKFSMRLSKFDNQLEYIVTFCVFTVKMFKPETIKILKTVIWFIDWKNLSRTSPSPNTQAMAELIAKMREHTTNMFAVKNFQACLDTLYHIATDIDNVLNDFSNYYFESYKGEIRAYIAANMEGSVSLDTIKARFPIVFQGRPFHTRLVEELLKEDYAPDAQDTRQSVLQKLAIDDNETQIEIDTQSYKQLLMDGLHALGGTADTLYKIIEKIEHNHEVYRTRRKSLIETIMDIIAMMFNKRRTSDFYECKMPDTSDIRIEIIDHNLFIEELNEKAKIMRSYTITEKNKAYLESISEVDLLDHLSQKIYDIQRCSRLMAALDEFFKNETGIRNKKHIRGIRPEITMIKSALSKAIIKKEYYLIGQRLEEELPSEPQIEVLLA
jgi:hypothetical protein